MFIDLSSFIFMFMIIFLRSIVTLQASHQANDTTITPQFNDLIDAFNQSANDLAATPVSSGSTTTRPTNDDISINYANVLS
jgi:hypothetical protein